VDQETRAAGALDSAPKAPRYPIMKVQFEFSAADVAEVAQRAAERSKTIRDSRWHAAASWSALLSLILFLLLEGAFIIRAAFAVLFGLVVFFLYFRHGRSSPSGRYLQYYREQLGGDGPFLCEVEIGPEGVVTRQSGAEIRRPWSALKGIVETPDAVEFVWHIGGLLVVRDRAFLTPDSRSAFLQTARDLMAAGADQRYEPN
jgi:YcxB-like protein